MSGKLPPERLWRGRRESVGLPEPAGVERCGYCDFRAEGPIEDAREAFAEHVCGRPWQ